ncbi:MAG: GIY-YIG nuclease family protein [Candidatus Yanofskybacteria bacterium]|nr:GIY-YIG nuclease family protein [Candidatus Yanofskybacteria bacterium]
MFFFAYVIESKKTEELYIGYSNDLRRRLEEHNNGENRSTKHNYPWKLIYYEACINQQDAIRREKYLKTNQGRRLLKSRVREYLYSRRF